MSCDCGSNLPAGAPSSAARFAHNRSPEHRLAVLRQSGAPRYMIARVEAELREHRELPLCLRLGTCALRPDGAHEATGNGSC